MNLILVKTEEIAADGTVTLDARRSGHVLQILRAAPGARLKVGVLNGPRGTGTVIHSAGRTVTLSLQLDGSAPEEPPLDLALALPRPIMLKRILFHASSLGIARIFLIRSRRVEKSYFDANLLQPQHYLPVLEEGMEQSCDTWLPRISVFPRFLPFAEDYLPTVRKDEARLLADPEAATTLPLIATKDKTKRFLLAIGPEGGWVDFEREVFQKQDFAPFTIGSRILRVETAIAVIAGQLLLLRDLHHLPEACRKSLTNIPEKSHN